MNASQLDSIFADFASRKWVTVEKGLVEEDTFIRITDEGKEAFKEIQMAQHNTRMQLFEGLTMEDYERTINVLKTIVEIGKNDVKICN